MITIMRKAFIVITAVFSCSAVADARPAIDFSAGLGYAAGVTQYEIGGVMRRPSGSTAIPFPISRLEFPLDLAFFAAEAQWKINSEWRATGALKRSFTNPGSDMKDSDWLFSGFGSDETKDIYSSSETDCDMWVADIWSSYSLLEALHGQSALTGVDPRIKYHIFAGLGYMHHNFSYDVHDLDQFYPRRPDLPHDLAQGTILKYDLTFDIPYILAGCDAVFGESWMLELQARASWFTHAQDKDQHLLRQMVSKIDSDWDGTTYSASIKARYNINEKWFCAIGGEILYISLEAESHTTQPNYAPYTINQEIDSNQSSIYLTVGYGF